MPHANIQPDTANTMSEQPLTNGEQPKSQFISHLISYPVVADSISVYKANPYGQKSINIAVSAYDTFGKPIVIHLQGPYSYVAPYVTKADSLANEGLNKVEEKFPIIKEETEKVKGTVFDYALFPVRIAEQGKEYLFSTYKDEYQKTGGEGLTTTAKAIVSTELKLAADFFQFLASTLSAKKEAAKQAVNEKLNN